MIGIGSLGPNTPSVDFIGRKNRFLVNHHQGPEALTDGSGAGNTKQVNDPFGLRQKYANDKAVINCLDALDKALKSFDPKTNSLDLSGIDLSSLSNISVDGNRLNLERFILALASNLGMTKPYPLTEAILSGADLSGADLSGANLYGAKLEWSQIV